MPTAGASTDAGALATEAAPRCAPGNAKSPPVPLPVSAAPPGMPIPEVPACGSDGVDSLTSGKVASRGAEPGRIGPAPDSGRKRAGRTTRPATAAAVPAKATNASTMAGVRASRQEGGSRRRRFNCRRTHWRGHGHGGTQGMQGVERAVGAVVDESPECDDGLPVDQENKAGVGMMQNPLQQLPQQSRVVAATFGQNGVAQLRNAGAHCV